MVSSRRWAFNAEFLWADHFRPLVSLERVRHAFEQAVHDAVGYARGSAARYLPGWSGPQAGD